MEMYERYVDDINMCLRATERGMRYVDGSLIYTQEADDEDKDVPADKRTYRVIQEIANTIHPRIKLRLTYLQIILMESCRYWI